MSKRKYHLVSHLGNTGETALNCSAQKSSQTSLIEETMQFSSFAGLGEKTKQRFFYLRIWTELLSLGLCNKATKSLVMVYSCRVRWIITHADSLTRNLWITEVTFQEGQKKVPKNCQRPLCHCQMKLRARSANWNDFRGALNTSICGHVHCWNSATSGREISTFGWKTSAPHTRLDRQQNMGADKSHERCFSRAIRDMGTRPYRFHHPLSLPPKWYRS